MTASITRIETLRRSLSFDNARALALLIATVVLLGVVYMGQASQAALTGQRIKDKQDRLERILRENAQLEADVAALMTPSRIEARARALGLHPPTSDQMKYLTINNYPTENPNPVLAKQTEPVAPPSSGASNVAAWWTGVLARIGLRSGSRAAEATTNP